jgi:hypothetical protein
MYKNPLILVVEFMSLTFFSSKKVARTGDWSQDKGRNKHFEREKGFT